ncbi:hypothetical protein BDV38DRAFT_234260 [Aspergillus pseudotamarii]|uniref:Uncharacterized protein n=1 Tax=Aspergillus pseudotamarii TaxID=132259 RepID=A0A5N6T9F7_ASPPS|nr:uncharacterized protein BDV38DRAFT_234260 [Aspergillus pseudotamarii]KAE8142926.1 hypothetical protein BDV38DRAFT_234260 [Aspergillus pseudotamarii]
MNVYLSIQTVSVLACFLTVNSNMHFRTGRSRCMITNLSSHPQSWFAHPRSSLVTNYTK